MRFYLLTTVVETTPGKSFKKFALKIVLQEVLNSLKTLVNRAGYKPYEQKHGESLFTRLFQGYILPTRFGFDKRRPHLSSLILSNQMSRFNALAELKKLPYEDDELELDISYFCKKLNITRSEFDSFMQLPQGFSTSYKNWDTRYKFFKKIHHSRKAVVYYYIWLLLELR